jgi:hypothetical protein
MKLCVGKGISPLHIYRLSRFTPHETDPTVPFELLATRDLELIWTPVGNRSLFPRIFSKIKKKYNPLRYLQFIFIVTCVYFIL